MLNSNIKDINGTLQQHEKIQLQRCLKSLGIGESSDMPRLLSSMVKEIERQKHQLELQEEASVQDMEVAQKILNNNTRNYSLQLPNVNHVNHAMEILSGDLILGTQTPGNGQAFMLADFTGHGLPAAIGTMIVSDTFYTMIAKGFSVMDVLPEINKKLFEMMPTSRFMSCCLLKIHPGFECFSILNAGLPEILVYSSDGNCLHEIKSSALPLGVLPSTELKVEFSNYQIIGGEKIYVYSDGVCETENVRGEQYGISGIKGLISSAWNSSNIIEKLITDLDGYRSNIAQSDDIAVLEVACTENLEESYSSKSKKYAFTRPPGTWQLCYELGADEMRDADPIPKIMHFIMDIQGEGIERSILYLVLAELYANALDHGVLGLDSSLKDEVNGYVKYYELREKRLAELVDEKIEIKLQHEPQNGHGKLTIEIKDSGAGFDFTRASMSLDENTLSHGRGLPLVRKKVKCLEFTGAGNEVRAEYHWKYKK